MALFFFLLGIDQFFPFPNNKVDDVSFLGHPSDKVRLTPMNKLCCTCKSKESTIMLVTLGMNIHYIKQNSINIARTLHHSAHSFFNTKTKWVESTIIDANILNRGCVVQALIFDTRIQWLSATCRICIKLESKAGKVGNWLLPNCGIFNPNISPLL